MPKFLNDLTLGDGTNGVSLVLGTTTGTKIGTSTSQKLSFYGVTTVVQQTPSTELRQMLVNYGLLSSTAAQNLDLNGGTLTAAGLTFTGLRTIYESRALPVSSTVNNCINIGSFTFTNGGATLDIDIVVADSGFSVGKKYQIPIQYNASAAYQKAIPLTDTGAYSGNDFDLDILIISNICTLRLRRSLGTTAGTARVTIKQYGVTTDAYSSSSTVTQNTAPTTTYGIISAGQLNVTTDLASGAQIKIQSFSGHAGWIDMPAISGKASGLGHGGPGVNPWVAYAGSNGNWFGDSIAGDICYRNTTSAIRIGNSGNASLVFSGNNIIANNPLITNSELDAAQISMSGNILMNGFALFLGSGTDSLDGFSLNAEGGAINASNYNGEVDGGGAPIDISIVGADSSYPASANGGGVTLRGGRSTNSGGGNSAYGGVIIIQGGSGDDPNGGTIFVTSGDQEPLSGGAGGNIVFNNGAGNGEINFNSSARTTGVRFYGTASSTLFYVDSTNNRVGVKTTGTSGVDFDVNGYNRGTRLAAGSITSTSGRVNIVAGTTAADGIYWGTDTNLYRTASGNLRTDSIFTHSPASGITTTSTDGIVIANSVAATSGVSNQMSPRLKLRGRAFDSLGDSTTDFVIETLPVVASTASALLKFGYSYRGGSVTYPMSLSSAGSLLLDGNSTITSNPPSAGTNIGWKTSYFLGAYALGIANSTLAIKTGTWLSVFGGNPVNDASGSTPDTGASVSLGTSNNILFGTDTNLYRSAANTLKTDDALTVVGTLTGGLVDVAKLELLVGGNAWSTWCSTGDVTNVKGFFTTVNTQYVSGTTFSPVDTSKSSWYMGANGTNVAGAGYDNFRISRAPIGSSTYTDLLVLSNTGILTVSSVLASSISNNISTQRVIVSKSGTTVGTRQQINLIEGANVSLTVADNSGSDSVDVTINSTSGASYSLTFNATTDWGTASGGKYTITFTHSLNTYNCAIELWDETSGKIQTFGGDVTMPSVNTVTISVPQTPDGRFAGRIVILTNGSGTGAAAYLSAPNAFTNSNSFAISDASNPVLSLTQSNTGGYTFNFGDSNLLSGFLGALTFDQVYGIPVKINGSGAGPENGFPMYIIVVEESCFLAGTPVLTPSGPRPIETLAVGDKVISMDEESRFTFENEITHVLVHKESKNGYLIINEQMKVTPNHKIYVNDQWMPISQAKIGDYLVNKNGKKVWIYSIEEIPDKVVSYNIKVKEKSKNYFANDLLVHNKCPFLYVFDKGKWIYQNTFIYELDAPEKQAVQRRKLRTLTNEFVIREIEPETSYIKDLALIAVTPSGEKRCKWVNRIDNLVTKHRDFVKVTFEPLPPDTTELYVEAEGYYIWQGD